MALTKAHNRMIEGAVTNVRDYGAKGDGVTDDTAAIQAAIDAQKTNPAKPVYMPSGTYMFSQIKVPRNFSLIGDGSRGTLPSNSTMGGTILKQIDASEKDGILFDLQGSADDNISSILFKGFMLIGPDSVSTAETHGIHVDDPDSADQPDFAGTVIFEDLFIRYWKGSGIYTAGAKLWNFRVQNVVSRENGRYGFETNDGVIIGATSINHITLEYNRLGGMYIGRLGSERQIEINNIYIEGGGTTGRYGVEPTTSLTSPYGVVLKGKAAGSRAAGVSIKNGVFFGEDPNNPDSFIRLDYSGGYASYNVTWENITIRSDYASGNAYTFYDVVTSEAISSDYISGTWSGGDSFIQRNGGIAFNTTGADGFIEIRRSGTLEGYIGANSDGVGLYDSSDDAAVKIDVDGILSLYDVASVRDSGSSTPGRLDPQTDSALRFGSSGARWTELFAVTGTINTSDQNDKQQIRSLTDAETAVATACKALVKAYKWNDSVTSKGDNARIHVGVIAQELDAAFTAQGLDASDYGMFCSDTWWTDADGKIYDQAGDGLTEHTRLGVRYDQLLAFIISAL